MQKPVETSGDSVAAAAAAKTEISRLNNSVKNLSGIVSLLYRDMEHVNHMCSVAKTYLDPEVDDHILSGDEMMSVINIIDIIACKCEQYGNG